MSTVQLFMDDSPLFRREHLSRRNTPMEHVADYSDGVTNVVHPGGYVFRQADGTYRLFYSGTLLGGEPQLHQLTAVSDDGIRFRPDDRAAERAGVKDPVLPHQFIADFPRSSEIHSMVEDPEARPDARYKMLACRFLPDRLTLWDAVYVSPDLIRWTELPTARWHQRGTEPVGSTLYDPAGHRFLIFTRPDWGDRRIALVQTRDWENFSAPRMIMAPDSLDAPMAEHYGMFGFACGENMLGLLMTYLPTDHTTLRYKFDGGPVRSELVYSADGSFWRRTLRVPFVGQENTMFWPSGSQVRDGYFYLYGTSSETEHGDFFPDKLRSALKIYRTREHRFLSLAVDPGAAYGQLATRQCVLHGGAICWNLKAEHATCAIYEVTRDRCEVLCPHETCAPFSGDAAAWTPEWKDQPAWEDLQGRPLVFELRMDSGEVWSLSGDFSRLVTTEGFRYEAFRTLPTRRGF